MFLNRVELEEAIIVGETDFGEDCEDNWWDETYFILERTTDVLLNWREVRIGVMLIAFPFSVFRFFFCRFYGPSHRKGPWYCKKKNETIILQYGFHASSIK